MPKRYRTKDEIIAQIRASRFIQKVKSPDVIDLHNKRVKINMEDFNKRIERKELSEKFMIWLDNNKEKEFTARLVAGKYHAYELEGVEDWHFAVQDLIEVEKD